MKVVGIDLSGPRNFADTCLVIFEEAEDELRFADSYEGIGDNQILDVISGLGRDGRTVIGIDAPLSYNPGGGDRTSDKELRKLAFKKGRVGIMPPTMIRMVYLTLRGINLTRGLETLKPDFPLEIVEVHPGATLLLHDAPSSAVSAFKRDPLARKQILDWLAMKGLKEILHDKNVSDHFVAACAATFGAWQWTLGKSAWCFSASPPDHPYDFAC